MALLGNLIVTGRSTFANNIYSTGYNKTSSSDSYFLTGGGGHKEVSRVLYSSSGTNVPGKTTTDFTLSNSKSGMQRIAVYLKTASNISYNCIILPGDTGSQWMYVTIAASATASDAFVAGFNLSADKQIRITTSTAFTLLKVVGYPY